MPVACDCDLRTYNNSTTTTTTTTTTTFTTTTAIAYENSKQREGLVFSLTTIPTTITIISNITIHIDKRLVLPFKNSELSLDLTYIFPKTGK